MGLIFNIKLLQCSRGWSQVGHTAGRPFVVHGWGIPARTLGPGNKRTVYNTQDSHQKEEKPRSQKNQEEGATQKATIRLPKTATLKRYVHPRRIEPTRQPNGIQYIVKKGQLVIMPRERCFFVKIFIRVKVKAVFYLG